MTFLAQDLRYTVRQFARKPGFAVGVVLVLTLGMGAGAAMFSVLRGTLLQPLPYTSPERLVDLQSHADDGRVTENHSVDVDAWRNRSHSLAGIATYTGADGFLNTGKLDTRADVTSAAHDLFPVLGVAPALGRSFSLQEEATQAPVIVLSDALWRGAFAQDAHVLGRVILLNGQPRTVIGVMPPAFVFPLSANHPQAWIPLAPSASAHDRDFSGPGVHVVARMQAGAGASSIAAELTSYQKQLRALYTGGLSSALAPSSVQVHTLREALDQEARPALEAISAAVAVLWLIACASAAGLMLARSAARAQEFALRGALGATKWRLVRQLLTESLVLAFVSALLGTALSLQLLTLANRVLERQLHHLVSTSPSAPVLLAMAGLVVLTTAFFGTVPALLLNHGPLEANLREGGARSGTGLIQTRLQQGLIVGEFALTLTLLVACGLLLRTVFSLRQIPLGFRTDHILVAELQLPSFRYDHTDLLRTVYRPLLEKAQRLPGVQVASLSTVMPLSGDFDMTYGMFVTKQGRTKPEESYLKLRMATPELQQVLGFHMLKGRYFNATDTPTSQIVAVVNKAYAARYDPGGKDWAAGNLTFGDVHVVGIVDDFHQTSMLNDAVPELQLCAAQLKSDSKVPFTGVYQTLMQAHVELALRTQLAPQVLAPELDKLLRSVDPTLASSTIRTMDQIVDDSIGSQLLASRLLLVFSGIALSVALAGLYSLLSLSVVSRTRELGVRLALGAQRRDVLLLVFRDAGALLCGGTLLGVLVSLGTAQLMKTFLYGVPATDRITPLFAILLMLLCGGLAAFFPARRAAATDPMHALRAE